MTWKGLWMMRSYVLDCDCGFRATYMFYPSDEIKVMCSYCDKPLNVVEREKRSERRETR